MENDISRRDFIRRAGIGTIGLGFGVSVFDSVYQYAEALTEEEKHAMLMKGTVNFMGFRAKEITPNSEFYITTYSDRRPNINADTFQLRVEGLVGRPYALTIKDLKAMKDKTEFVTLECIGNPVGGDAIGNALWEGVTLRKIIDTAYPKAGIVKTVFYAADGYSDSIPYELSLSDDVFLAYGMNDQPLPLEHGYPLRAIIPGIFGMKNVKWLSKIELVNYDYKGYWEKEGWSDSSVIPAMSEILMPMNGRQIPAGNYVIGGIAFGGRHGISRVQISLDDGRTWNEASLKKPLSNWSWSLWSYNWDPGRKGNYTLKVRGIDKAGKIQESGSLLRLITRSYPDGARGLHSLDVKVI
ncbi:MAG TPA: molybdopterin-dependent oxidoreductase [Dissulfurispiraceae bacterium]|nr:molybdopterin-dependent oxidoreductase [Dissulfurispiraceae bacterium]